MMMLGGRSLLVVSRVPGSSEPRSMGACPLTTAASPRARMALILTQCALEANSQKIA